MTDPTAERPIAEPNADESTPAEPETRRGPRRRVTTLPPAGSDPSPVREPDRHAPHENDERMFREKPPHY